MINSRILPKEASPSQEVCNICAETKPQRQPISKKATKSGETVVQVDYMPMGYKERGWKGEVGAYVFTSRASKIVKVYPVKSLEATHAAESLSDYLTFIVPYMKEKITCIQTDVGTQFTSYPWMKRCAEEKLRSRTCPVDHQAMNGQVERVQGILASKARGLILSRNVPLKFWPLALETAAFLLNRTPHNGLNGMTPYEACTGNKPDLNRARTFGCAAYVQIPKPLRKGKLSPTARHGTMVGYSTHSPEWLIMHPKSGKIRRAYSVKFNEEEVGTEPDMSNEPTRWHNENRAQIRNLIEDWWERTKEAKVDVSNEQENEGTPFARKWAMGSDEPYTERMDDNSNKKENNNVWYATLNTDLSYNEALNGPDQSKWKIAIQEELDGLQEKEVFSDEICPPETAIRNTFCIYGETEC